MANISKRFVSVVSVLVASVHSPLAQQSLLDVTVPARTQVAQALSLLREMSPVESQTAKELLSIYRAAEIVGRCVWRGTAGMDSPEGVDPPIESRYADSTLGSQCLMHVQLHLTRFRVVRDGWKGEGNFMEPSRWWDSLAHRLHPNSPESNEISFDLDFKDMIRTFDIDLGAAGKTCDKYCKDVLSGRAEMYREVYSQEEIDKWPEECAATRQRFERERATLLEKYRDAPFTKILQGIDVTTIVVFHGVC